MRYAGPIHINRKCIYTYDWGQGMLNAALPHFRECVTQRGFHRPNRSKTLGHENRKYFPRRYAPISLAWLYTQLRLTERRAATSSTVRRCFPSRPSPTVAPFASVSGKSKTSTLAIPEAEAVASCCNNSTAAAGLGDDELTARRGACCLGDAVFSRIPNWVGRSFMVTRRPSQELLLWVFRCCGGLCVGLSTV